MKSVLIIPQIEDNLITNSIFKVTHTLPTHQEAIDALRTAVRPYVANDPVAKEYNQYINNDFNWGDLFVCELPANYLPEGILSIEYIQEDVVVVEHDELLVK